MRCSSSLFFRRGGDGLGLSRLVPSKDAGEAVPLIALVCSGTLFVRVLAVSLFLSLCLFFFRLFFRRDECILRHHAKRRRVPSPQVLSKGGGGRGGSSFRKREMRLSVSVFILFCGVFASFLNENQKYVLLSVSIRSPRWGDLYVEANPSFAWILCLARGKETRHRRASPREASERPKVVQTSSEKVFRGKE